MDRALSGATLLGQSRPGSDGSEGVLCVPQRPSITGTSPSDCLMSYPGQSLYTLFIKCSLYIYIKYIWFGLVGFYGISTIVVYLMPNPLYTYILNI